MNLMFLNRALATAKPSEAVIANFMRGPMSPQDERQRRAMFARVKSAYPGGGANAVLRPGQRLAGVPTPDTDPTARVPMGGGGVGAYPVNLKPLQSAVAAAGNLVPHSSFDARTGQTVQSWDRTAKRLRKAIGTLGIA